MNKVKFNRLQLIPGLVQLLGSFGGVFENPGELIAACPVNRPKGMSGRLGLGPWRRKARWGWLRRPPGCVARLPLPPLSLGTPFAWRGGAEAAPRAVDLPCLMEAMGAKFRVPMPRRARLAKRRGTDLRVAPYPPITGRLRQSCSSPSPSILPHFLASVCDFIYWNIAP
jgi:hypothetical protein